jgi:phage terminase small subunit
MVLGMAETSDNTWADGLTEKQRRFCEAFSSNGGNATAAAREAGYGKPHVQCVVILESVSVKKALEKLRSKTTKAAILTREQRQALWSQIALDESVRMGDRLKAMELLGRSQADFIERREITGADGQPLKAEVRVKFVSTKDKTSG